MAMKIKFVNEEIITPIFKDIKEGEMFVFNGNLCMKIGKVYSVSDIRYEVDECHDLTDSEDIDSEKYNTVSRFLFLHSVYPQINFQIFRHR